MSGSERMDGQAQNVLLGNKLVDIVSMLNPDEDVLDIVFNFIPLIPPEEQSMVLEAASIHNMKATVRDQLSITFPATGLHLPSFPIEHRRQSRNHCSIESLNRAIQAVGVTASADELSQKGVDLGHVDTCSLPDAITVAHSFKDIDEEVKIAMFPDASSDEFAKAFVRHMLNPNISSSLVGPKEDLTIDQQIGLTNKWLTSLDNGNALVLSVRDAISLWRIPKRSRGVPSAHSVALVGYNVDERNRLSFAIYDPAFSQAPLFVGPMHLTQNADELYLEVSRR